MTQSMYGFELEREEYIAELNTTAKLFRHTKTGAEVLSLENDDINKVFGVSFRTTPSDNTGVPHILEHVVLAGSRKFPVKEPFLELVKGSLQTFINAMTFPDKTVYPVASTNTQDFYNLADVYLDAVFHPNITPEKLMREGWHFDLPSADAELQFKGIVFNEMKGAYSSPDGVLGRYSQQSVFPDNTYGVDSGGDPTEIPNLTYEQFKNFYDTYYHPSNARIWFYGDDPLEQRLELLAGYLDEFEARPADTSIPLQAPFDAPRYFEYPYDASASDDGQAPKAMVSVNWMLGEPLDADEVMAQSMLSRLLLRSTGAPLRKRLLDLELGEELVGGGLNPGYRQMMFTTGLRGVAVDDADKVEQAVLDALQAIVDEGIDPAEIEATVNTYEFRIREQNTGSAPRGLMLFFSALTTWNYDGDPLAMLAFEEPLAQIKQRIADNPRFFEDLIARSLLNNPHRGVVTLKPDDTIAQRLLAQERARLDAIRAEMSDDDVAAAVAQTHQLAELLETPDSPEALAKLPSLQLSDLEREIKTVPQAIDEVNGLKVLHHDLFTNGIVYFEACFDMQVLPQELLPYFGVFMDLLVDVGTVDLDYVQLSQRIGQKTGGIFPSSMLSRSRVLDADLGFMFLRGKATADNVAVLFDLMRTVLQDIRLNDPQRVRQIMVEARSGIEAGLVGSGHVVVMDRLAAHFNVADWANEHVDGLEYLFFLRRMLNDFDANWEDLQAKLEQVRDLLINRNAMTLNFTIDQDNFSKLEAPLHAFIDAFPATDITRHVWTPTPPIAYEGLTIPAQVNYVGKALDVFKTGYAYTAAARVVTKQISLAYLFEKVRMMGGAYGGFARLDSQSGVFAFASYRDPNLLNTLDTYDRTPQFLREMRIDEQTLTRAIIGGISDLDRHLLPDARGHGAFVRHLMGVTDEMRQQRRNEVLNTTIQDFRDFADVLEAVASEGHVVVLGAADQIKNANAQRGGAWLTVNRVL